MAQKTAFCPLSLAALQNNDVVRSALKYYSAKASARINQSRIYFIQAQGLHVTQQCR